MGVRINTNIEAMNAQRNLGITANAYAKSVEKLSSGLRINRAADDAAGLAISQKLDAQVRGLNQAQRNAQDGISMVQTAEGALNEVQSMMQRMRELAVQASNSTLSASDLTSVNTELQQLKSEVNRIAGSTTFNGQFLLTGALTVSQTGGTVNAGFSVAAGTNTSVTGVDVSGAKGSTTYTLSNAAGVLTLSDGAGNSQALDLTSLNVAANGSQVLDFSNLGVKITVASVAGETGANVAAGLDAGTVITGAGSGATFQVGANATDHINVSFAKIDLSGAVGGGSALDTLATALGSFNSTQSVANAQSLITAVDGALNSVSTARGTFGAYQNRLEHTIASVGVASENLAASESRIKDLDVAAEMVNFTKTQILQQAGTAILAQANSAPQTILQLLK